jgi:hypothetical protein
MNLKNTFQRSYRKSKAKEETKIPLKLASSYSILLIIALGYVLNNIFQLRIHIILIAFITVLFTGLVHLLNQYKKNILCYLVIMGFFALLFVINLLFKLDYKLVIMNIYDWCMIYNGDDILYHRGNAFALLSSILLLGCLVSYPLHRYRLTKRIIASLLPIILVFTAIYDVEIPKLTVGVVLFYCLTELVEFCGRIFYRSNNWVNNGIATIYLAPACAVIAFTAVILPSKPEPIQWTGVKNLIAKAYEQSSIWMTQLEYFVDRSGSEFSVNYAGYSEEDDGDLGGNVTVSEKTTLIVETKYKSTSRGYLIGSISDIYTGRKWEKSDSLRNFNKEDYYYDLYELINGFAIEAELGKNLENLVKKKSYEIAYHNIRTRSLFYPLKTYNINFRKEPKISETYQGGLLFHKARSKGTNYEVQYYELNLNSEVLKNILRQPPNSDLVMTENKLKQVAEDLFGYNTYWLEFDMSNLTSILEERTNRIKTQYTSLPDSLPQRVVLLTNELTKEYDNDYDKLKAIEGYLNSLLYSTRVNKTPEGEDFVDYFLFNQQKGYCTYFATAMAIMARCVGIPTRYVEGFVVDYNTKDSNYSYKVLSSNAHSWVDAYIEGIGWIPFEPTPTFYSGRYTPWKDLIDTIESYDTIEPIDEYSIIPPYYDSLANEYEFIEPYQNEPTNQNIKSYVITTILVVISFFILLIVIFYLYYRWILRRYNKIYDSGTNDKKLFMKVVEILNYLEKDGYQLATDETLLNYANRIGERLKFNNQTFLDVTTIFMSVRYGEKEVENEELQLVLEFCNHFREYLIEKSGKRKMFFQRFIFLHFYQ